MVDVVGAAKVLVETVVDQNKAKQAGKKAGEAVADGVEDGGDVGGQGFAGKLGPSLIKAVGALGIGAAVGAQIMKGIERTGEGARLAASLGLDAKEAAELNESASEIYKEAWGASFADVQKGVAATKSSFQDLNGEELTDAARSAQIFADVFAIDVVEAAGVASIAVKQGLAKDAVEAFDLMTKAAQQVPLQFRGELLEAIHEYSSFFQSLGIDGPEAFALLAEGAALGQYGIDKVGDSIKEFQIRSIDASATTADAFKLLKLDQEEMQTAIATGGDTAEAAFRKIVEAIDTIKDPAEQAQAAIALFGTPIEDLSQDELPLFIDALANGTAGMEDFKGSTERAGEQAGSTFSSQLKTLGRTLDVNVGQVFSDFAKNWAKGWNDIGGWIDSGIDKLKEFWEWQMRVGDAPTPTGDDVPDAPDIGNPQGTAVGGPAGGLTLVGERGPELLQLPAGSYVHNAPATQSIIDEVRAASGGGNTQNYYITGPVSLAELRQRAAWYDTYGTRFG